MNKFEAAYKLETERGITLILRDYPRLKELRFYASDLSISDLLIDFEIAMKRSLTARQKEVIELIYISDRSQDTVAKMLGLSQQTVQEHTKKAIKNLATYHLILKGKGD